MNNVQKWINGVVGAMIGAMASSVTVIIVDPTQFVVSKRLALGIVISGVVGAASYLKQHPTPWNGVDRRNGNGKGENGK